MFKKIDFLFCWILLCYVTFLQAEKSWDNSKIIVNRRPVNQPIAKKQCSKINGRLAAVKSKKVLEKVKKAVGKIYSK